MIVVRAWCLVSYYQDQSKITMQLNVKIHMWTHKKIRHTSMTVLILFSYSLLLYLICTMYKYYDTITTQPISPELGLTLRWPNNSELLTSALTYVILFPLRQEYSGREILSTKLILISMLNPVMMGWAPMPSSILNM